MKTATAKTAPPATAKSNTATTAQANPQSSIPNSQSPPLAIAPFNADQAKAHQEACAKHLGVPVEQTNSIGMKLRLIPPGEFLMGSAPEEVEATLKTALDAEAKDYTLNRIRSEAPQHAVTISGPFLAGESEVTVGQFRQFVESTTYITEAEQYGFGDSSSKLPDETVTPEMRKRSWRAPGNAVTDRSAVTQVTWNDCVVFCNWLSKQDKLKPSYRQDVEGWVLAPETDGYRLPSEAQWEYACRAGTTTQYSFGDDALQLERYGWYKANWVGQAPAVGEKLPNAFGLFDMHGNVAESCQDWRDGGWYDKTPSKGN